MAVYEEGFVPSGGASRAGLFVNYAGAAMSLALIAGVSFWGYKLIMRDVSGIPVVRAMAGEMRVAPDNPGGDVASHVGLSVNEVAAEGEAGGPEDRLVLAPATAGLTQEDLDVQPMAEADEPRAFAQTRVSPAIADADAPVTAENAALTADDIIALADQIADGVEPFAPQQIAASVPGVARSLRPVIRPAVLRRAAPTVAAQSADDVAVSTVAFPAGTDLVQLGAFRSPDLAGEEWTRLQRRFGQLMSGRDRVIQVANQSNGTWYRLRASGFDDRADARRFCAALEAEGADCIAVVVD
ncbi:SPOR domain-containing protein [Loktanella agnita]|uniref:SPOR domain-containing protein n=1 Tax=Loktanella agnita TaxID=287097 RepID=UPI0039880EB4